MPVYTFKPFAEMVRAVGIAVVVFIALAAAALKTDTSILVHPAAYFVTFGTGLASVIGTAVLGVLTQERN